MSSPNSRSIPKVSVVMPVYNGLPYLLSALESVVNQSYEDFELVIINDGSTDGTGGALSSFARRDSRIRVITQENSGITTSLNTGVALSRGEYIARMDADDICMPDRLSLQVRFLDQHPQCVLVGGQVQLINAEGNLVSNIRRPPVDPVTGRMKKLWQDHRSIERALLNGEWPLVQPAVMIKRSAIRLVGGYDEKYPRVQDHDLFLKLAEIGKLANLPDVVLQYRRHTDQVTNQVVDQNYLLRSIRRSAYQRRGHPLPRDLRWPSMVRSRVGMELRKTAAWPYFLSFYNRMFA